MALAEHLIHVRPDSCQNIFAVFSQFILTPGTVSSIIVTIMIPIRSTIKTEIIPYVNYTLLAVNIAIFAYTLSLTGESLEMFYQTHGIVPSKITALNTYGFFERTAKYFSSMFIHENWVHIAGNLIFLYIFGNGIEDLLGHTRYLLFYLVCGLVAVFIQVILNSHSTIPAIGASGAISGVLGAYMLFFPKIKDPHASDSTGFCPLRTHKCLSVHNFLVCRSVSDRNRLYW